MDSKFLNDMVTVSAQITLEDLQELKRDGVQTVVCNRPDNEQSIGGQSAQIPFEQVRAAASLLRMTAVHIPFVGDYMTASDVNQLENILKTNQRLHLYCRSGARSSVLWAMAVAELGYQEESVIKKVNDAGYKLTKDKLESLLARETKDKTNKERIEHYDVVVVGGGSGGLGACASLRKRNKEISIAVVEPSEVIYYQPGWTMVGGGVFDASTTKRQIRNLLAKDVVWLRKSVVSIFPDKNLVQLENGQSIQYQQLVVASGLELNWEGIEGLSKTLGKNGVTSNYRYDLAPYTWELVQGLKSGKAVFTQPPMPIKCAGAPQKAMYLSADHWYRNNLLANIKVEFYSSGDGIFGVPDYVPALQQYLQKYAVKTNFKHTLIKVDGDNKTAYFKSEDGLRKEVISETKFDMLHVCPPQRAPKFIRESSLCDDGGWLDVDQQTLAHRQYPNIWGIGDVINAPNAKTLAAVRKQVPVVVQNLLNSMVGKMPEAAYSGYGSCPLTVERGKIVLAEFVYGGKHKPTFPQWLNDGTKPTRFAWWLKAKVLPYVYWKLMLHGVEWFAQPDQLKHKP